MAYVTGPQLHPRLLPRMVAVRPLVVFFTCQRNEDVQLALEVMVLHALEHPCGEVVLTCIHRIVQCFNTTQSGVVTQHEGCEKHEWYLPW
jgi:hypothetical protein